MEWASAPESDAGAPSSKGGLYLVHPSAVEAENSSRSCKTVSEVKAEHSGQADEQGDVEAPETPSIVAAADAIPDLECPQRPSIYDDFTSSFPDGLAFWKSFLATFVVCVTAGALQFVLIPNSNPLHDKQRKGIWHCAVGCATVWMPISMLYIVFMTGRWVIRGTGVTLKLTDLLIMWACAAVLFTGSVLFWNSIWVYPFPFGGFPSASGGLIALGSAMWVMLYRRFKQRGLSSEQFRTCLFKGVMVFVVFVWSLVLLVFIMLLLGASQYVPPWTCALSFPIIRYIVKRASEVLLRFIDDEATIVAENLTMTSFGIGLTLMIGNTGNAYFAIAVALLDVACGMVTAVQMRDNALLRAFLRLRLLGRRPTDTNIQRALDVGKATFIASEVGEVIVPITYVVVFMVVYSGPYAVAFTGIGTAEFGVKPPEDKRSFLQTMAVLILGDAIGTFILKFLVNWVTGLNTIHEMCDFYRRYGTILTIQTIWIIHTAFCAVMLLCGLDYSFKLEMLGA